MSAGEQKARQRHGGCARSCLHDGRDATNLEQTWRRSSTTVRLSQQTQCTTFCCPSTAASTSSSLSDPFRWQSGSPRVTGFPRTQPPRPTATGSSVFKVAGPRRAQRTVYKAPGLSLLPRSLDRRHRHTRNGLRLETYAVCFRQFPEQSARFTCIEFFRQFSVIKPQIAI